MKDSELSNGTESSIEAARQTPSQADCDAAPHAMAGTPDSIVGIHDTSVEASSMKAPSGQFRTTWVEPVGEREVAIGYERSTLDSLLAVGGSSVPDREASVRATTRLMGLLGADVRHADLAFSFNNRLLALWGSEFLYVPYSVPSARLVDAVNGIRALDILSCNVTFPHKVPIVDYLNEIDETARLIGSVNLVVNRSGWLSGYNTDSQGFVDALLETGMVGDLDSVLIYGAGGAGRAIATAIAVLGIPKIWIYDIIGSRSAEVEARLSQKGFDVSAVCFDRLGELRPALVVNATPLGRGREACNSPLEDLRIAQSALLFFDLNYSPPRSQFLLQAQDLGVAAENGLRMMCYQAKRSIEIAAGRQIPGDWFYDAMESEGLVGSLICAEVKDGNGDVWLGGKKHAG